MVKTLRFLPPSRTRSCSGNPTSQTPSAEGRSSVPGWGTKTLHARRVAKKNRIQRKTGIFSTDKRITEGC